MMTEDPRSGAWVSDERAYESVAKAAHSSAIHMGIDRLDEAVERLAKACVVLSEHLSPVLTPDHPRTVVEDVPSDRPLESAIAMNLARLADNVEAAVRRIGDLDSRVDL